LMNPPQDGAASVNIQAGRCAGATVPPMEFVSCGIVQPMLVELQVELVGGSAAPGVQVNRARSNCTTWLKMRFDVRFSVRTVRSVKGGVESASKKVWSPSYRLIPGGVRLSSTINVAGSLGSLTGRNCVPGMLTDDG